MICQKLGDKSPQAPKPGMPEVATSGISVGILILTLNQVHTILGDGRSNFYVVGGRRYNSDNHLWDYQTEARVYNKRDNRWRTLQPLANPISDGCLLTLGKGFKK